MPPPSVTDSWSCRTTPSVCQCAPSTETEARSRSWALASWLDWWVCIFEDASSQLAFLPILGPQLGRLVRPSFLSRREWLLTSLRWSAWVPQCSFGLLCAWRATVCNHFLVPFGSSNHKPQGAWSIAELIQTTLRLCRWIPSCRDAFLVWTARSAPRFYWGFSWRATLLVALRVTDLCRREPAALQKRIGGRTLRTIQSQEPE